MRWSSRLRGAGLIVRRVVDYEGNTIDFYLSPTHSAKAMTRFL